MERNLEIMFLMDELQAMPEYQLVLQLKGFTTSIFVFEHNFHQLCGLIRQLNHAPESDPIFTLRNRTHLQTELLHLIRLIHNYVAASQSLIDHTRNFYRKSYEGTGKFSDYQEKVEREFVNDPLAQFVKCLRQYCQHYRAPNVGMTFYFDRGDGKSLVKFNLLKTDLEQFDSWNKKAKEFLSSIDAEIDILALATAYKIKVEHFYRWFEQRLTDIHQVELNRFKEKESRLLLLQLEGTIDTFVAGSGRQNMRNPDEVFLSVFSADDYDLLDSTTTNPDERVSAAIRLCESKYFALPEDTQKRITNIYMNQ